MPATSLSVTALCEIVVLLVGLKGLVKKVGKLCLTLIQRKVVMLARDGQSVAREINLMRPAGTRGNIPS